MSSERMSCAYPGDEWYWYKTPSVNLGSSTVVRVKEDGEPDPKFKPRPVGFTAVIEPVEKEPQVWGGDGA